MSVLRRNGVEPAVIETYIPLYRKYRPQQFSDLVGQEVVSTAVQNALTQHKIAHAYLFCGPRGTGKTSSARIFAKSLNCSQGPTATPCQTCESCAAITQGTALDVTEIDAASNNGVDNIRDLTDKVHFSPIQGKFKIYIIDEVHMLSPAAFNALLKTLEEPPPNVVFIFATTEPHKVLPTIISRCQRFDFNRITRQQIEARLAQVAGLESINISAEAIALIARHVRGGLRDALGLLDQVSVLGRSDEGHQIGPQDVSSFIGLLEEDLLLEMAQGIIDKQPQQILQQIHHLQERGVEPAQMIRELATHFRNLLIAKTCGPAAPAEQLEIPPELYQKLCVQAQKLEPEEIPQMLARLSTMENQLRHSQQPMLWFEVGLLDMTYRHEIHLVRDLAARVQALEERLQGGGAPIPQAQPAQAAARPQPKATAPQPVMAAPPQPQPKPVAPSLEPQPVAVTHPPQQAPVSMPQPVSAPPEQPIQPSVVEASPVASTPLGGLGLEDTWRQILQAIPSMPTRQMISQQFRLIGIDAAMITIEATKTMWDMLTPAKQGHLEQAIAAVMGRPMKVNRQEVNAARPKENPAPAVTMSPPSPPALELVPNQPAQTPVMAQPVNTAIMPSAEQAAPTQPQPQVERVPVAVQVAPPANQDDLVEEGGVDIDLQEAKEYTQKLLQGKLLD